MFFLSHVTQIISINSNLAMTIPSFIQNSRLLYFSWIPCQHCQFIVLLCQLLPIVSQLQAHPSTVSSLMLGLELCKPHFYFASSSSLSIGQERDLRLSVYLMLTFCLIGVLVSIFSAKLYSCRNMFLTVVSELPSLPLLLPSPPLLQHSGSVSMPQTPVSALQDASFKLSDTSTS